MRAWTVVVPLAAYLAMAIALRRRLGGWRLPFLLAAVGWGLTLAVITEAFSRVRLLTRPSLLVAWLAVLAIVAVLARSRRGRPAAATDPPAGGLDAASRALLGITVVLVFTVGLTAVVAPPNTFDSLTYHMSRVAHWVQNASVEPYPTAVQRELYQSPAAEFVILHLQILSGGDRFANLVQWSAMAGSLLAASLVVRHLGGSPAAQVLAAVVVATIPMGVLQASSTQNDYVAAFWLTVMVAIGLVSAAQSSLPRSWLVLAVGGALGLAILTKPTAYLIGGPFAGVIVLWWARTSGLRRGALAAVTVGLVALAANAGQYSRNAAVYGSPLGPTDDQGYEYGAATLRPAFVASTVMRNISLHLATPSERLNESLERALRGVHRILGVDPDDPRVTWRGQRFSMPRWEPHEDLAGNPLHLLLIGAAVVAVVGRPRRRLLLVAYAVALALAWLLFSVVLKWQPWHSRLQLPVFVLGAPLVALAFGERVRFRVALAAALLIAAIPAALWNASRPLVGSGSVLRRDRTELYFTSVPGGMAPYASAARVLRELGCLRIGLDSGGGAVAEYPVWVLTRTRRSPAARIEHVGGAAPFPPSERFAPCAVVTWAERGDAYAHGGVLYRRVWGSDAISVYAVPPWPLLARLERLARAAEQPLVRLSTDGDTVHVGQRLSLWVDVQLTNDGPPLELYAGLLFPDGLGVSFFTAPGVLTPPIDVRRVPILTPLMTLRPAPSNARVVLLDGRLPPAAPGGTYRAFAAVGQASRERTPDSDGIVAADVRSLRVVP